eukprot:COSAG01_NODE_52248_length_348_cov_0.614458_1_plen_25_part_10
MGVCTPRCHYCHHPTTPLSYPPPRP